MVEVEIWFSDLNKKKQDEITKAYGITSADEMNWDLIPLTILEIERE